MVIATAAYSMRLTAMMTMMMMVTLVVFAVVIWGGRVQVVCAVGDVTIYFFFYLDHAIFIFGF